MIGTRGWSLRSCRAYPKNGTTAVMRLALARRHASIMINNSIKCWFAGGHVGCTMNTSRPRTFSLILTNVSSSGNAVTVASPSGTPM